MLSSSLCRIPSRVNKINNEVVGVKSNVAGVAALTSKTMPYCSLLDYIISSDMRDVTDVSVPSSYIISHDMHGVTDANVLNSYNTRSDHHLIYITLYVIHRLRPLPTNRDFKYRQVQLATSATMARRNFEKSWRAVDASYAL
uniref:Uncharacterized protein n=1 Tax=Plectus sambesii TaxID=2011161 RepID=A0A914W9J7_9BILA